MKKIGFFLLVLAPLLVAGSLYAVTYPFPERGPAYLDNDAVIKSGARLYLFHSGTEVVKRALHVNDILAVYRVYPPEFSLANKETGKVRILSVAGDYYFEAEVIEGEMQPGYLAKKGTVACCITPFKKKWA